MLAASTFQACVLWERRQRKCEAVRSGRRLHPMGIYLSTVRREGHARFLFPFLSLSLSHCERVHFISVLNNVKLLIFSTFARHKQNINTATRLGACGMGHAAAQQRIQGGLQRQSKTANFACTLGKAKQKLGNIFGNWRNYFEIKFLVALPPPTSLSPPLQQSTLL